ncbi:MAG: hypothetical protein ACLT4Y_11070 [Bifidobacterium breve]
MEITSARTHISTTFIQEWNKDPNTSATSASVGEERPCAIPWSPSVVMSCAFAWTRTSAANRATSTCSASIQDPDEHIEHRTMVV